MYPSHDPIACMVQRMEYGQKRVVLDQAIITLKRSIQLNPRLSNTYLILGRAYCLSGQYESAVEAYRDYIRLRPNNPLGHIELGFAYEAISYSNSSGPSHDIELALRQWREAGFDAQSFSQIGDRLLSNGLNAEALQWYWRSLQIDPGNQDVRLNIGRICQASWPDNAEICQYYFQKYSANLIVDPEFPANDVLSLWKAYENSPEVQYRSDECPEFPGKLCYHIIITHSAPANGAGLYQCVRLQAGKYYRYSVWARLKLADQKWRILYFEGKIEGSDRGYWLKDTPQASSQDWNLWEISFTAPLFDDNMACFHPVRVEGAGEAWFHSPRLELAQDH